MGEITFAVLHTLKFDPDLLDDHYDRHKRDFGATSQADYENLARTFLTTQPTGNPMQCRACLSCSCFVYGFIHVCTIKGDTIKFNPVTTELAILGANGFIRTYFKPTAAMTGGRRNIEYFHFRCTPKP